MKDLGTVDLFVAGAVGEPGARTFMLQFVQNDVRTSYVLEKAQVAALAEQSRELLHNVGLGGAGSDLPGAEPWYADDVAFRVAAMQLAHTEASGLFTLALLPTEEATDSVAYTLSAAQLGAAARDGLAAVEAGRPKCPRCGLAMDPTGHHCPATNGDLRNHRP